MEILICNWKESTSISTKPAVSLLENENGISLTVFFYMQAFFMRTSRFWFLSCSSRKVRKKTRLQYRGILSQLKDIYISNFFLTFYVFLLNGHFVYLHAVKLSFSRRLRIIIIINQMECQCARERKKMSYEIVFHCFL